MSQPPPFDARAYEKESRKIKVDQYVTSLRAQPLAVALRVLRESVANWEAIALTRRRELAQLSTPILPTTAEERYRMSYYMYARDIRNVDRERAGQEEYRRRQLYPARHASEEADDVLEFLRDAERHFAPPPLPTYRVARRERFPPLTLQLLHPLVTRVANRLNAEIARREYEQYLENVRQLQQELAEARLLRRELTEARAREDEAREALENYDPISLFWEEVMRTELVDTHPTVGHVYSSEAIVINYQLTLAGQELKARIFDLIHGLDNERKISIEAKFLAYVFDQIRERWFASLFRVEPNFIDPVIFPQLSVAT